MRPHALVVYHGGDCADGFTAAWVAREALMARGATVTMWPMLYGAAMPAYDRVRDDTIVYVLDFSDPSVAELEKFVPVVMLDHHRTAQATFAGMTPTREESLFLFDVTKSGAMLTWEHFHPGSPPPALVEYVQDRDLWTWALSDSREYNALVGCAPHDFDLWGLLAAEPIAAVVSRGRGALYHLEMCKLAVAKYRRILFFAGHSVPVVNVPHVLVSEVLEVLCKSETMPFAVGWFQRSDGKYQYSLRSQAPHGIDVSEIAKRYPGGGGHKHAAGFTVDKPVVMLNAQGEIA